MKEEKQNFEEAIKELEVIASELENGDLSLDESVAKFEQGMKLSKKCSDLLPVSVIYGPNGGGKSNLLHALACLISTVVKPVHDL